MLRAKIKRNLLESLQARILIDTLQEAKNPKNATKNRKQTLQARFFWDSLLFFSI
ncbi:hypothetical protein [Helicobacter sp. T3_23-1056]